MYMQFVYQQALQYVGSKVRQRATWGKSRSKVEEARELLAGVMLAHVPVNIKINTCTLFCKSITNFKSRKGYRRK